MINVDAIKKLIDQMPQIKSQFTTESYPVASMYDYNARTRKTFNMDLQTIYKQPEFLQWKEQLLFELSKIENDDFMIEASNPVPTPLLGHRCRSSQEITGSPTPFSTSNHYLWICASASFSLSNPNIAA